MGRLLWWKEWSSGIVRGNFNGEWRGRKRARKVKSPKGLRRAILPRIGFKGLSFKQPPSPLRPGGEGKEFEVRLPDHRPGHLSERLKVFPRQSLPIGAKERRVLRWPWGRRVGHPRPADTNV